MARGLASGTVLGEAYRVGRRIAEGGMGSVYEAEHLRVGRRCAIKVLAPELSANREALTRFEREVDIMAKLAHPHVVQVLDVGHLTTGEPYLVMEYLDGEDLARRLRRGRMALPDAIEIAKQIGAALAGMHAHDIVHRDLKPANVFLVDVHGSRDFVKVVDFGISKVARSADKLTRASMLIGTPEYMAPEQASGRADKADPRTDQWALGAIVWEMLSGRPPFVAPEMSALLFAIVHDPPPRLLDGAGGPAVEAIEAVLLRALAKRPADRYGSVTAFLRALESAAVTAAATGAITAPAAAPPPVTKPTLFGRLTRWGGYTRWAALDPALVIDSFPTPPPPRKTRWLAAGVLPLLLAAAAAWVWWGGKLPAALVAPERAPATTPR